MVWTSLPSLRFAHTISQVGRERSGGVACSPGRAHARAEFHSARVGRPYGRAEPSKRRMLSGARVPLPPPAEAAHGCFGMGYPGNRRYPEISDISGYLLISRQLPGRGLQLPPAEPTQPEMPRQGHGRQKTRTTLIGVAGRVASPELQATRGGERLRLSEARWLEPYGWQP